MDIYWESLTNISQLLIAKEDEIKKHQKAIKLLKETTNCSAVAISHFNPTTHSHRTLCSFGYSDTTLDHLNNWFVKHDKVYHYMKKVDNRPLRWKEMPFPYRETFSAKNVFIPAGYEEGVTVCLYNKKNLYTGALHISSEYPIFPCDKSMSLIYSMQNIIGSSIDFFDMSEIPSPIYSVIFEKLEGNQYVCNRIPNEKEISYLVNKIDTIGVSNIPTKFFYAFKSKCYLVQKKEFTNLVLLNIFTNELPYLLTFREIEVASLMMDGLTNVEIGERLQITRKTVAHHVSSIIQKLNSKTRTQAAIKIQREGLITLL